MSGQSPWLFERPAVQVSNYNANPEYETLLENEWEMSTENPYNFPMAEDEWEVSRIRRPMNRARQPMGHPHRPVSRATRIPQRRPAMPHRQQRHSTVAQRPFRQPVSSPQGSGIEEEPKIIIATIDRFEFGSYLLKKHQFERLDDLVTVLKYKHE